VRNAEVSERVRDLVAPSLEAAGLELFDVELAGNVLRVLIDREGGVDLDAVSEATQRVSALLDGAEEIVPGRYLLEVSSPGIERPLRTPVHFQRAVGSSVALKLRAEVEGERRVDGVLEAADGDAATVGGRSIPYAEIERAHTCFVWPQPTRPRAGGTPKTSRKAGARP
jgi:ribosome maturation factor RimP